MHSDIANLAEDMQSQEGLNIHALPEIVMSQTNDNYSIIATDGSVYLFTNSPTSQANSTSSISSCDNENIPSHEQLEHYFASGRPKYPHTYGQTTEDAARHAMAKKIYGLEQAFKNKNGDVADNNSVGIAEHNGQGTIQAG